MPEAVVTGSFKIILYALHQGTDDPARPTFIER